MGDILDKISININTDDVTHDWTYTGTSASDQINEFFSSPQIDIKGEFLKGGYKLIKQTYPYKGIRYGGPSSFDSKYSLFNGFNMALDMATSNKVQNNLDKLVMETFYGNSSDDTVQASDEEDRNEPCNSAGAVGTFDGEYWKGEMNVDWLKKTSAKEMASKHPLIVDTANKYAPKYDMAPARCIAQVMIEGGWRNPNNVNGADCRGIGQFAKPTWGGVVKRAIKKFPELKKYETSWSASSNNGGPGHDVLGTIVMMEYMSGIHKQHMEKTLPGKDEDFWWSAIGYLMGPVRAAKILKACDGDRSKCDEEARKVGIGSYAKKGVAFYGNSMLKKWKEYSKQVPKSQKDSSTESDEPETSTTSCSTESTQVGTVSGDVTSKKKWVPGQELGDINLSKSFGANCKSYGCPLGKGGKPWMAGDAPGNKKSHGSIHVEFEAALKTAFSEMKKEGHKAWSIKSCSGFRTYAHQLSLGGRSGKTGVAGAGRSAHNVGYAIDLFDGGNSLNSSRSSARQKWMHKNGPRFGIFFPLLHSRTALEVWHAQLHPDLAYTLKQRYEARGKKWD